MLFRGIILPQSQSLLIQTLKYVNLLLSVQLIGNSEDFRSSSYKFQIIPCYDLGTWSCKN